MAELLAAGIQDNVGWGKTSVDSENGRALRTEGSNTTLQVFLSPEFEAS